MFGFFERQRLIKKGLATAKRRRQRSRSDVFRLLETGTWPKLAILSGFLLGLGMLIFYGTLQQPAEKFLIGLLIFATAVVQLWINHPETFARNSRILLIFSIFLLHLAMIKGLLLLGRAGTINLNLATLLIPYAFAPLTLSVLLGKNHGLYAAIFVSLWGSVVFREIDPAIFVVMSLICGFIAVFVTLQVRRRSRLLRAGMFVGLSTLILAVMFPGLIGPFNPESFGGTNWGLILQQCLVAVGSGVLTAVLVSGVIPLLENAFHITTDISWLEAADLNHPLLKRMTIEAPGTYHHSLVVANLAEAAAEKVGANATMCRVCSYFHDIGKLVKPEYFTENMSFDRNPHDELAPTMSALIIIAHVKEGVDLALKHGLNQQVVDVIQQHHGTSIVQYFYRRALQQREDACEGGKIMNIREDDIPEVREEGFRYGGPKPQTREAAIINLADSVESASRSLEKPTPQKIEQLIRDIFKARIHDQQLEECLLTMREIGQIAESFKFTMRSMMHSRIAYPSEGSGSAPQGAVRPAGAPPVSAA